MKKGNHPKVDESPGFLYLRHSNWTICSLLSFFCSKKFPSSWSLYWELPFLITPEKGKWEKGNLPKLDYTQGFLYLRHLNWTICSKLSLFCSKIFPSSWYLYWELPFLITPEPDRGKWEKWNHPKLDETQRFLDMGPSNWTISVG